jgi:hypothetical protein
MESSAIVYVGVDESGRLNDPNSVFAVAGIITQRPSDLQHVIQRAASRSGKRLHRIRRAVGEFKWNNSSERFRQDVLKQLAQKNVKVVSLAVEKSGRTIEDSPQHSAILICELLQLCWGEYPQMVLTLDKRFTSPAQMAEMDTFIYRHLPSANTLSIHHVDSQRSNLVQLADFVAGSIREQYVKHDATSLLLQPIILSQSVGSWVEIKRKWLGM